MKIKALALALVLGSSSAALAAPSVRDHREPQAPVAQHVGGFRRPVQASITLAADTRVTMRTRIAVPESTRAVSKLELKAETGRTKLDRVVIQFGNGQTQVAKLDSVLAGRSSLTIDLEGGSRFIKTITLVGSSNRRSSIDVLAI